ncbi:endonuclease Q family protein [Sediminibacillus massiliensis]|uniref:endonuclease Q family protein n=1 Tax=Sediminibacillus massiliensis TaxID=1926277 RepID=UPI0009886B52|nr:endonuclease Q family protein [Sediminibacillus massiliensis]
MSLTTFFADLHIHIGRDLHNKPVKITGARSLTLTNILIESSQRKGMDIIGVIDSHVPSVQAELEDLIHAGKAEEQADGGIRFDRTTLILGSEIEIYDRFCQGPVHVLCFFPTLSKMKEFSNWLQGKMTNINLSSQRYYGTGKELQYKVKELSGLFIPAHVFTPFKSLYGKGVKKTLTEVFDKDLIDAVELGLSADTKMADRISELHRYTFLTNSDAHSLAKIGREYQKLELNEPTFQELVLAIQEIDGRKVSANYGMNPLLGKYHVSVCANCLEPVQTSEPCKSCQGNKWIKGVSDRIDELSDSDHTISRRPPYIHQVPLEYLPTLGPKTMDKLLEAFDTEMDVLHNTTKEELEKVVSEKLAQAIIAMRSGKLPVIPGGGGKYGRVKL